MCHAPSILVSTLQFRSAQTIHKVKVLVIVPFSNGYNKGLITSLEDLFS